MIVKESDFIWITNYFKRQLRFNCGFWIKLGHQIDIIEVRLMIHKHGVSNISCQHWIPFLNWDKTRSWAHKLIDTDNLATFKDLILYCLVIFLVFVIPSMEIAFSTSTTWTSGGVYIREVSGNDIWSGHKFEFGKSGMPKSLIRGSIPAKVEYWEGLRIFSYIPTPTKLTNAISKTQLSGPKKGRFLPKIPQMCQFFGFWHVLAVFSSFKPAEWALNHFLCH